MRRDGLCKCCPSNCQTDSYRCPLCELISFKLMCLKCYLWIRCLYSLPIASRQLLFGNRTAAHVFPSEVYVILQ